MGHAQLCGHEIYKPVRFKVLMFVRVSCIFHTPTKHTAVKSRRFLEAESSSFFCTF